MATTDMQRLVVALEARTKAFENAMNKANGVANRRAKAIESRFAKMNKNLGGQFAALGGKLGTAFAVAGGTRGAQDLIDSATRIENALKVAGLSGSELTKVYDRLFQSAQKNSAPIEDLVTLYSRASLSAAELGVSQERLLKFTDNVGLALRAAGTDAATASGALLQLSQALGSGTVRAEEFNSIQEGALPVLQAVAAGIKEAGGSVAKLRKLVIDGKLSSKAFFDGYEAGAPVLEQKVAGAAQTTSQKLVQLRNVLIDAAGDFNKGSKAAEAFGGFIDDVQRAIEDTDFRKFGEQIAEYIKWVNDARKALEQWLVQQGLADAERWGTDRIGEYIAGAANSIGITGVTSERTMRRRFGTIPLSDSPQTPSGFGDLTASAVNTYIKTRYAGRPADPILADGKTGRLAEVSKKPSQITLADYPVDKDPKKSKAPKKTAADRFNEDLQAIRDRTAALKEEQVALGLTFREQEKRAVALDLEQQALADLREAARQKGEKDLESIQLSAEQKAAIDKVADAYAAQADALRQLTEIQELQRDVLKGAFSDIRGALDDGKLGWDDLANVALNALDKIINKIEDDLIDAILRANSAAEGDGFLGWIGKAAGLLFGGGGNSPAAMASIANGTAHTFDKGGYTGPGGRKQAAGIVHKGEVVFNQDDVRRHGGPAAVNAMRRGAMPSVPAIPQGGSSVYSPSLTINAPNAQPGVGAEIEAAGRKIMEQMRKEFPINTAKALKTIKRMGYNQ